MKDSNGESVTVTATLTKALDPSALVTAMPGQKCVGVTVAVVNGSSTEWLYPLLELSVVDSAGQKYTALNGIATCLDVHEHRQPCRRRTRIGQRLLRGSVDRRARCQLDAIRPIGTGVPDAVGVSA